MLARRYDPSPGVKAVEIHPHLSLLLTLGCAAGAAYCLVLLSSAHFVENGRLMYISEGFYKNCGWSGAVLGTSGGLICLVQAIVAEHIGSSRALAAVAVQFVSWNFLIGVLSTGWVLHNVALGLFLASTVVFHRCVSVTEQYGSQTYRAANLFTLLAAVAFAIVFIPAHVMQDNVYVRKVCISVAVSMEYVILLSMSAQQIAIARTLGSFTTMTILFKL